MGKVLHWLASFVAVTLGAITWSAPPWMAFLLRKRRAHRGKFWFILLLALAVYGGYSYYLSLPKPLMVKADIVAPAKPNPSPRSSAPTLNVSFVYDKSTLSEGEVLPTGKPSVARIDLVGEEVLEGIVISPEIEGTWQWWNDSYLRFTPSEPWPAGTEYSVEFDQTVFAQDITLSQYRYSFETPAFTAVLNPPEFYQDPRDISVRRVVATAHFSHPVDPVSFEQHVRLYTRSLKEDGGRELNVVGHSVSYSKDRHQAYIHSDPVALPERSNYLVVDIDKGVKPQLGGAATTVKTAGKVLVPDLYSFLKVDDIRVHIVKNAEGIPQQVLSLSFTDYIEEKELLSKLGLYLLPIHSHHKRTWRGPREVNSAALSKSKAIPLQHLPNEKSYAKIHNFVLDETPSRQLYLKIAGGLSSVNKFVHSSVYDNVLGLPEYPKEVEIVGDGSLLTSAGNQKISVLSRGLNALKYKVGRVRENQLYHLISQTYGDITNPEFSGWRFGQDNIVEFDSEVVAIQSAHPKDARYSSLALNDFNSQMEQKLGLYYVEVQGWDRKTNRAVYGAVSKRLVLVSDLGIIVKNNADGTRDVFVQSIRTGKPVAGATIELLGKNGVPLFSLISSSLGHGSVPSTQGFAQEKEPTVYVVKTGNDMSFIPYNRHSRQINLSRYDIGGVSAANFQNTTLNSFVFSDRGIYRPGETAHLGVAVKNFDMSNVSDVPVEVVIRNPRYSEVKVHKVRLPDVGFFDIDFPTDATSETGVYQVSVHLVRDKKRRGREIGSTSFKVEEFQPDTMKIDSQLVGIGKQGWINAKELTANVNLRNLFGSPAQNRRTRGRLQISPSSFEFKAYSDYRFTSPFLTEDSASLSLNTTLADTNTDADGRASFNLDLDKFQGGTYKLKFTAEGFDQAGGRSVKSINTALISPFDYLVGYKANGNLNYINAKSERNVEFIAISQSLETLAKKSLSLELLEIQHISTLVKHHDGTYRYQSVKREESLGSNPVVFDKQGYVHPIDTASPGDYALVIKDAKGYQVARVNYSIVGTGNLAGKIDKHEELVVKLDKSDYQAGEDIELSIKAPYVGAGLISIESDKVHQFKWFSTKTQSSIHNIRIPTGLEGNAYVNVSFVRDIGSREIYTSPLSYAVVPFSIDKSKRRIDLSLEVPEIVRPGKNMSIGFSASESSKVVVFAVNEGILQVANYKTPDPLGHFLQKRSLDVSTMQIMDLLLPDFDLVKSLSAAGGGAAREMRALAKNINPFARKLDAPAVYWSGIVDAGPESSSVEFAVPDTFAGELRVMAVAVGREAVGAVADSSIVRGPFVLSPNLLTQAAPGDEFDVTLGVANIMDGSGKNAAIKIQVNGTKHLSFIGDTTRTLNIDEGSEASATFRVRATSNLGAAEITFIATHGEEKLQRRASFSVRPAMPYFTRLTTGYENNGNLRHTIDRALFPDLALQQISASSSPLVLVDGLTQYLENYPHGCTEQVVSKVFPIVGLMNHPYFASSETEEEQQIQEHFSHLINKLRERQLASGGFSFWPGGGVVADYPSIYVAHFLVEAEALGLSVPRDMLNRTKQFLEEFVTRSSTGLDQARNRANAIYVLTRMGSVTTNYLVDLEDQLELDNAKKWRKDLSASYMAASYQLLQKHAIAKRLIQGYRIGEKAGSDYGDFHSPLAQDAQHVYLLARHFPDRVKNLDGQYILDLVDRIFKGEYNTISSAYSVLALGAYSQVTADVKAELPVDNVEAAAQALTFLLKDTSGKITDITTKYTPFPTASYPVVEAGSVLETSADSSLFYLDMQAGFDAVFPDSPVRKGLEVYRDFLDEQGKVISNARQGDELTVRLKIRALDNKTLTNIALIDLLPGGFEVIRSSVQRKAYDWRASYVDVREDRVVYYGDFDSRVKEISYRVKVTSSGAFVVPPTYAESMYDRSISAMSAVSTFKVAPQAEVSP